VVHDPGIGVTDVVCRRVPLETNVQLDGRNLLQRNPMLEAVAEEEPSQRLETPPHPGRERLGADDHVREHEGSVEVPTPLDIRDPGDIPSVTGAQLFVDDVAHQEEVVLVHVFTLLR